LPDSEHAPVERSEESAIESEIAVRLVELAEHTSPSRAAMFLSKLYALHSAEPAAFWFVVRILSGDLTEVTRSYSEQGALHATSKQAQQQAAERVISVITHHYPEAAQAIIQIRGITARINPE
jgi:hypothetical protein